ncbi:hypothetical protein ACT009_17225 [Sphingomonas sp. Tas61C01]|uniref:hypothetical protein n=1 Tax=Sphingomonas sp. Tas61C01 TaxID=3458297 RepID=UPI00403E372D
MSHLPRLLGVLALVALASGSRAAPSPFDLVGPRLDVAVTRNGTTLPIDWVPNLAEGDLISIQLDQPPSGDERFRMVATFLRGAVARPPNGWFHDTVSGTRKGGKLSLVVPKGAQQLALFVLPEKGGGANAIASAVRKQPGAFVRAVQELNQASLDRARLDTYLDTLLKVERDDPGSVGGASQVLTRSLAIKLKAECLQQPAELQAACLTGDRETLLFADTHSSALADTLTGTPTDLAFQLSATPQAGYGSYSSYIGVVRDLFRLFGAFQSTQLQFVPALAKLGDGRVTLLLNTPLSFGKPASVMVIGLPAIEAPKPPPLRRPDDAQTRCGMAGAVLPVEGAPLVYATRYAHNVVVRAVRTDGTTLDLPAHADPRRGGYVLDRGLPTDGVGPLVEARLHGDWGFSSFAGPHFDLSNPQLNKWQAASNESLVIGRTNSLTLAGAGEGCIARIEMQAGGAAPRTLDWKPAGPGRIAVDVPLEKAAPGPVTLTITSAAQAVPASVTLPALQELGRVDGLLVASGDEEAVLIGSRLDQVRAVTLGDVALRPADLTRADGTDRLRLLAADPAALASLTAGSRLVADVGFTGNRHKTVTATVAQRPATPTLLHRSVASPVRPGAIGIELRPDDVFAQDARVTFAFRLDPSAPLDGRETVEVATTDGTASASLTSGKGYDLQDATTGIATLVPGELLGSLARGPLRFRIVKDGVASRWAAVGSAVRLPAIRAAVCATADRCTITGDRLFLIRAVATDERFATAQPIADGFTATTIDLPRPPAAPARLYLRMRDAPDAVGIIATGTLPD